MIYFLYIVKIVEISIFQAFKLLFYSLLKGGIGLEKNAYGFRSTP